MTLIAPLSALPIRAGQAALTVITLVLLMVVAAYYSRNLLFVALALTTPFVIDHVLRGQLDAVVLSGAVLACYAVQHRRPLLVSVALWLMAIKPVNVTLVGLLVAVSIRRWSWREIAVVLSLPALSLAGSFVVIGWDWPARYVTNYNRVPLIQDFSVTLWNDFGPWLIIPGVLSIMWLVTVAKGES